MDCKEKESSSGNLATFLQSLTLETLATEGIDTIAELIAYLLENADIILHLLGLYQAFQA